MGEKKIENVYSVISHFIVGEYIVNSNIYVYIKYCVKYMKYHLYQANSRKGNERAGSACLHRSHSVFTNA